MGNEDWSSWSTPANALQAPTNGKVYLGQIGKSSYPMRDMSQVLDFKIRMDDLTITNGVG